MASEPTARSRVDDPAPPLAESTVGQSPDELESARRRSALGGDVPPAELEEYCLIRLLGRGTFGEVWRAQKRTTGVDFAIKFLNERYRTQVHLLREEAKKLAMLNLARGVVHIHDLNDQGELPYFVMDYLENGSLAARLARGPLPVAEALVLFRHVVEAMAYVHARGIRHCDLKPGNILLDAVGSPRVADFGQAQLSGGATSAAAGTFFYMAPEQARAEKLIPDARWDVYSLGALFYKMLIGQPPHYDEEFQKDLASTRFGPSDEESQKGSAASSRPSHQFDRYRERVQSDPPPRQHHQVAGMDRNLAGIIDRCLALDPEKRYRDAGDLLEAIHRRERRLRARPLLLFSLLAPLLLIAVGGVLGFSMVTQVTGAVEASVTDQLGASDSVVAHLGANLVHERLTLLSGRMTQYSENARLKQALARFLDSPSDNRSALPLEQQLAELLRADPSKNIQLLSVFDANGTLVAGYMLNPDETGEYRGDGTANRSLYGINYAYRDYFSRQGDQYHRKNDPPHARLTYRPNPFTTTDAPYVGQPYLSTAQKRKFLGVTVSVPLIDQKRMLGVLSAGVELEALRDWIGPVEKRGGCVVILDRNGYCLNHRKAVLDQERFQPGKDRLPEKPSLREIDPLVAAENGIHHNFRDPFDGETKIAAYAPVADFGWHVIAEHAHDAVLAEVNATRTRLYWSLGSAALFCGVAFSALWAWLLFKVLPAEADCDG